MTAATGKQATGNRHRPTLPVVSAAVKAANPAIECRPKRTLL